MNSNESINEIYAGCFADNWSLPALSDYTEHRTLTYGDLATSIARHHMLFESIGLCRGDKVALLGRNTIEWVSVFMAVLTYGATVVPILSDFSTDDATHIINHSGATLLFVDDSIWDSMEFEKMPAIRGVISLAKGHLLAEHPLNDDMIRKAVKGLNRRFRTKYKGNYDSQHIKYPVSHPEDLAVLNYTSGTTGFSKGVMLTHRNLWGNVTYGVSRRLHYQGSRCLSFLPLAHAFGCAFDMLTPLATGSHITLLGRLPSPRILLKAFAEVKPNLVLCVPLILEKIYKQQILPMIVKKPIRWVLAIPGVDIALYTIIRRKLVAAFGGEFEEVIVGGAPLNPEVEDFLQRIKFPFTVGYGMTECGPLISYTPWRDFRPGSAGQILEGFMECRIDSPDPANIPGEICVRGTNVMRGYYKNPKATSEVLDNDGWLHTGDMGTRSSDGTIFIKGRYKTMILSASGQNIYPEEIEAKLNNMPMVAESLVVERNGRLIALVYPDYEAMDRFGITSSQLPDEMEKVRADLNKIVAPYEQIDRIQLRANEFEKTPKRSIKRYLYKD